MKNNRYMKNRLNKNITVLMALFVCVSFFSCDDFLEKPPGTDVTEETIFSTQKDIETFLYGTYMVGLHSYYPYNDNNSSRNPNPIMQMTAAITDEAEMGDTFYSSQNWNSGAITRDGIKGSEDGRWDLRMEAIRRCNIIIERMPDAPVSEAIKDQFTGEVTFIRALNNFELLKRYGGMPIVKKRLLPTDDMAIPRATVKDYVDFIKEDCEEAARLLKDVTYTTNQRGRVTYLAALALKSKLLLYAASPLFNTDKPYLSTLNSDLICYGNYDVKRWEEAAKAAKAVIDAAPSYGISILNTGDPENDYRRVWDTNDNVEIILAEKYMNNVGNWEQPWKLISPACLSGMNGWSGVCVTHNFIRKYERMSDGMPQEWAEPDVVGTDLMKKYAELDPRFRQTVAYNGSAWNNVYPDMTLYEGGDYNVRQNVTGAFMHKTIPTALSNSQRATPNGILFRLAEAYLNYAEALNESNPTPPAEAFDALDIIRQRAGMPSIPRTLNQKQLRERIKNERDIELAFEDHRMWDIRRWMDAEKEGVMQGGFYKVTIYKKSGLGLKSNCDYKISRYETRVFHRKMYLHPIIQHEVNKGYLIQNPGW